MFTRWPSLIGIACDNIVVSTVKAQMRRMHDLYMQQFTLNDFATFSQIRIITIYLVWRHRAQTVEQRRRQSLLCESWINNNNMEQNYPKHFNIDNKTLDIYMYIPRQNCSCWCILFLWRDQNTLQQMCHSVTLVQCLLLLLQVRESAMSRRVCRREANGLKVEILRVLVCWMSIVASNLRLWVSGLRICFY